MSESTPADRNQGPILEVLSRRLPAQGRVLEIASGTGQHAVFFAAALPGLEWQPSDADPACCERIEARRAACGLDNVNPPLILDVLREPWPIDGADAIVCINMVHISPWAATRTLFSGAARLLPAQAPLFLYGPYRRFGQHTAASNAEFDASLRARNPDWGVRDLEDVIAAADEQGLAMAELVAMPANNFIVVLRRRATGG